MRLSGVCFYFGAEEGDVVGAVFSALLRLPLFRKLTRRSFAGVLKGIGLDFAGRGTNRIVIGTNSAYDRLVFMLGNRVSSYASSTGASCDSARCFRTPCIVRPRSLFKVDASCISTCATRARARAIDVDGTFIVDRLFGCSVFHLGCVGVVDGHTRDLGDHL